MAVMTHRQRIVAALAHQQPDRVPMDLAATIDSSIVLEGYERLKQYFGIQAESVLINRMMRVVNVDERILKALDTDARGVFPPSPPDVLIGADRYRDEWGVERVRPAGSYYHDQLSFPLSGEITVQDIAHYKWPDPHDPIRVQGLKERVKAIHDAGYAAVLNMRSAFIHASQYLRGFSDWFMDFAADRKLLGALFDAVLEVNLEICRVHLKEVGREVDVLLTADDLGLQGGLMVSHPAYLEMIKPRHKKYFQLMHDLSQAKVLFHTCGSVYDIMDDLVEIGVDAIHPVQVAAARMDPVTLKKKWGNKMAFWGGIDTQHILPFGSVAEVEAEVERRIEQLGEGGGYVLGAVHNLQPDVPAENIIAMYRHAREYRPSFAK